MVFGKLSATLRSLPCGVAAVLIAMLFAAPAQGAFHLWRVQEIYSNTGGTLQFIELFTSSGGQNPVQGQFINVTNLANTITHSFQLPGGSLPGNTAGKSLLFGTAGIQAAGSPVPDYIIPNGFLFEDGGTINFFGANSGPYTELPHDGFLSRTFDSGTNALNSPRNYATQTGTIVPEPATLALGVGLIGLVRLVKRRRTV